MSSAELHRELRDGARAAERAQEHRADSQERQRRLEADAAALLESSRRLLRRGGERRAQDALARVRERAERMRERAGCIWEQAHRLAERVALLLKSSRPMVRRGAARRDGGDSRWGRPRA